MGDSSGITALVAERRRLQQARVLEVIDELADLAPTLDDEQLCWMIASLQRSARQRAQDQRDPWSVLLAALAPRPGGSVPATVLEWAFLEGHTGKVEQWGTSYVITLEATLRRTERRDVLAHELAHIELGTIWTDDTPAEVVYAGEVLTERRALERFGQP